VDEILSTVRDTMEQLAGKEEEVGPPYRYATIIQEGFRQVD
jgi:hypothetical protein